MMIPGTFFCLAVLRSQHRSWPAYLLAFLAVVFLGLMALSGAIPETGQLVKFAPRGVLQTPPERVRQVSLKAGEQQVHFVRLGQHEWCYRDTRRVLPEALRDHLVSAIIFMHASAPVRRMLAAEYQGTGLQEFGLEQPRYSVAFSDGGQVLLEAHFGSPNPQELLQYMRLQSSDAVYVMSGFIGQMWEHILEHVEP